MLQNEESIIKSAIKGDFSSFELIVSEYEALVYNTCYKLLNNREDAKDAAQDSFVKVYKNLSRFNRTGSLKAWIYRIAYNTCLDIIRKKKDVLSLDDENDEMSLLSKIPSDKMGVEEEILNREKRQAILKAVEQLKLEQKSLIILRDMEGFSYDEISKILNIPLGSVKSGISRSRKKLREIIENNGEL